MKVKNRNQIIDILRGFAAICVVLGHAIQRGMITGYENNWLFMLIYTFHMPLFILLSGYTLYLSSKKFDKKFLIEKTRYLLYPTIIWSYLIYFLRDFSFVGIKPFISFPDSIITYTKELILHPNYIIWFLYVLYVYNIIFYIGKKIPQRYFSTYIISVGAILFSLPSGYFGIYQIAQYYPFFVIGYYLPALKAAFYSEDKKLWIPALLYFILNFISWSLPVLQTLRYYIMALSVILLLYYVVRMISNELVKNTLSLIGKYSLYIYLTQCLFLNIGFGSGYLRILSIFVSALFMSFVATYLTTKVSFIRVILYGK